MTREQDDNLIRDTARLHKQTNVAESAFFMSVCNNFARYGVLSQGQREAVNKIRLVLERRAGATAPIPVKKTEHVKATHCKNCKKPISHYFKDDYQVLCDGCEEFLANEHIQNVEY